MSFTRFFCSLCMSFSINIFIGNLNTHFTGGNVEKQKFELTQLCESHWICSAVSDLDVRASEKTNWSNCELERYSKAARGLEGKDNGVELKGNFCHIFHHFRAFWLCRRNSCDLRRDERRRNINKQKNKNSKKGLFLVRPRNMNEDGWMMFMTKKISLRTTLKTMPRTRRLLLKVFKCFFKLWYFTFTDVEANRSWVGFELSFVIQHIDRHRIATFNSNSLYYCFSFFVHSTQFMLKPRDFTWQSFETID